MRKFLSLFGVAVLAASAGSYAWGADSGDKPIIEFTTSIYETYGEMNNFSIVLGGTEGEFVYVDCGFGEEEYELTEAVYDSETQSLSATIINCSVSSEGVVRIYGDASSIDYFNATGCYIRKIAFPDLTNLEILDLSHNEIESLDLSAFSKLKALYLSDNVFNVSPLKVGGNKPDLAILDMSIIENLDQSFSLSDYPSLVSFEAWACYDLHVVDPTQCPGLQRISIDVTPVESIDVSKNGSLLILNISDTKITSVDLSNNPYLTEFYCSHEGSRYEQYKFQTLDVSKNPELQRLYAGGNNLTSLDVSNNPKLTNLSVPNNNISSIVLPENDVIYEFDVRNNCLDFTTLPMPEDTWGDYQYGQKPLSVNRSYQEGTVLDFSGNVLRDGTETTATLYSVSNYNPATPSEVETSKYKYENGKITLLDAITDSVYVSFSNDKFPDSSLTTGRFMVKDAASFGADGTAVSFTTSVNPGSEISLSVGIDGASAESPKKFSVDFGDGVFKEFTATTSALPAAANVTGTRVQYGSIKINVPEGSDLTAFGADGIVMYSVDVTKAPMMRELSITGAELSYIDLQWNRCLTMLRLTGNKFSSLDLSGANGYYGKNVLSRIYLSDNGISELTLSPAATFRELDLSGNQLASLDLSDASNMTRLDISGNKFASIDLADCESLTYADISSNSISEVTMPETNVLATFICSDNELLLSSLPQKGGISDYRYAPQADFLVPTKGPGVDLSSQNLTIDGESTRYVWKTVGGETLVEGTHYTNNGGVISFKDTSVGEIYCEMSHPAFPLFSGDDAFKTTVIEAAGMPTNVIARFTTVNEGESASLSLAATKPGIAVYVDWAGTGEALEQYFLETTYKIFSATTHAGAEVKVYTYDEEGGDNNISVFSLSNATLSSIDASSLKQLTGFSVINAGLSEIGYPVSPGLTELNLEGNNLSSIDFGMFPNLYMVGLNSNQFTSLDLSSLKNLGVASASGNKDLATVTLDNPSLWFLDLSNSEKGALESIDLSGVPALEQLGLNGNILSSIDVSSLARLKALAINNNKFKFSTLPSVKSSYIVYNYANQAAVAVTPLAGKVDLSSEAEIDGVETVYKWYYDEPYYDENGELVGEELVEGTDYTIDGGVTTFLVSIDRAVCVMTNASFPSLTLYTPLLNVPAAGVDGVFADDEDVAPVYYDIQGRRVDNPAPGLYIVVRGTNVTKEVVK